MIYFCFLEHDSRASLQRSVKVKITDNIVFIKLNK